MLTILLGAALIAATLVPQTPARGSTASGDPCSSATSKETQGGTGDNTVLGDANTYYRKLAFEWVADSAFTACNVSVSIKKFGSPTANIRVRIYSNNGSNHPTTGGALTGGTSSYVSTAGLTTSYSNLSFTGLSASIANGTTYWLVVEAQSVGDASNYYHLQSGLGGDTDWDFDDDDNWSDLDNLNANFTINGY